VQSIEAAAALCGTTCSPSPTAVTEAVSESAWAIKIGKHGDDDPTMVHPQDPQPFDYILWPKEADTTRVLIEVNDDGTT
jgi:hypothetical protein